MNDGVLLVNLGSPDSPSVADVRRYLREFLMDKRVIDQGWLTRALIVYGCILPFRPKHSAEAYRKIWTKEGSPLVVTSRRVQAELRKRVAIPVELAMRYQNPTIQSAVQNLERAGVRRMLLIPLFPHYAMSSYETAVERVKEIARKHAPQMTIEAEPPCYALPEYLAALVASAEDYLKKGYDHLLFSFHGIPERQIRKSDPTGAHCLTVPNCCSVKSGAQATCYRSQCFATAAGFVAQAAIPREKYSISFQSRLGRHPWLKPYTDLELPRLAQEGKKKLLVICPAFVSDCLETIEEIRIRGRETFLSAGGKEFEQIPCLNEHPMWIEALESMIVRFQAKAQS